ncbi:AraC family transcriptional regulator [Bradyrhizobium sp.]|jgi:AraC-like DNA-binding protein|uniref:AraC family transcriptional regulator n=1 Tax=Bradyrhizobium sp. TaxID=376 RepID=UPI003D0FACDD
MPFLQPANPLNRSAVFRTSDIEKFKNAALPRFGATRSEISGPDAFEAHGRFVELQDIALLSAASNSSVAADYPEFDFARLSIPLTGRGVTTIGRETIEINQHQSCVTSPGRATRVRCGENHEWLNLRIKTTALRKKLTSILGARPNGDFQFRPVLNLDHPRSKGLCQLVGFFAQQLNSDAEELPPLVLQELEQAIVTTFLFASRHAFSGSLERDSREDSPWQVRRVENYIEANWNRAISIDDLVEITGTSARAIFRAFQRGRGYSPMAFAKMVRLQHAKELLVASKGNATVAAVALQCGFSNLGHFSREYREAFGDLPSTSLARSRSMPN